MPEKLVACTTIRQGEETNLVERVRSEVALETFRLLHDHGIPTIAVHTETSSAYLKNLSQLQVVTILQEASGMDVARRQALQASQESFPNAEFFFWLEPEKPDMVRFVQGLVTLMESEQSVLGLWNRNGMDSYPKEQAYYYLFDRAVASRLIGRDLDYGFGPMVLTPTSLPYFLNYNGRYGDQWDSILIPRLEIIHNQLGVSVQSIDFRNDPRMFSVEDGRADIILKRIEQLGKVVPSLITEWDALTNPGSR